MQGYEIKHNIVYQDNQSAIRMEKNGRNSCTGNSRHIDIRYFFVKDRVDKKELEIKYCPTYMMLADFFTKPLQGKAFRVYRDVLMGYKHISSLKVLTPYALKERVENTNMNEVIANSVKTNKERIKERISKDMKSLQKRDDEHKKREMTKESISTKDEMKTNSH